MDDLFSRNRNNFDALRLLAAFLVFYSHAFPIYGLPEPRLLRESRFFTPGTLGVTIFFTISGYLIAASLERSGSYRHFFLRRCARLYPAYWMNLIWLIFFLCPLVTTASLERYFHFLYNHWKPVAYRLVIFGSPPLPRMFSHNPMGILVNGPTWTLPWEAGCYMAIALISFLRCTQGNRLIFIVLTLLIANIYWEPKKVEDLGKIHCGSFALGAFYYFYRERIAFTIPYLAMAVLTFAALLYFDVYCIPAYQLLSSYIVISLGIMNNRWAFIEKYGDFSYGFYLYAWPVEQTMALHYRFLPAHFMAYVAVSLMVTLMAAILSWYIIERPFLVKARQLQWRVSHAYQI